MERRGNNKSRSGKAKIETVMRKKSISWIGTMLNYINFGRCCGEDLNLYSILESSPY